MPTPEEVKREADDAVREFARELGKQGQGVGVRSPPKIEVTQIKFERSPINLEMDRGAERTKSLEGPPPPPPVTGPVGACCVGGLCAVLTSFQCAGLGGIYMGDGTVCSPDPC